MNPELENPALINLNEIKLNLMKLELVYAGRYYLFVCLFVCLILGLLLWRYHTNLSFTHLLCLLKLKWVWKSLEKSEM